MEAEFDIFTLSNGIKVIHQEITNTHVAHCGLIINAGSRDETESQHGIAHFIEHSLFKGTKHRKAHHILSRLDAVGGELNAYTSKEDTCIYASFLDHHFERAIELLADVTFNSVFPEKELNKEKDVIIDEIHSYMDSPSEQIFDDFEELVFDKHELSYNILGNEEQIKKYTKKDLERFVRDHYTTDRIVFSSVGNITSRKLKTLLSKHLEVVPERSSTLVRSPFTNYVPKVLEVKKDIYQAHVMLGGIAYSAVDEKRRGLVLLNNILGGPALNSRLNMSVREKYGFTYSIDSSYNSFCDTGLFAIYLGTDQKFLKKSLRLVRKELDLLMNKKLTASQLKQSQEQLMGQIALGQESKVNIMLSIGKALLLFEKIDSIKEIQEKIGKVTALEMMDVANEIFDKDKLSLLTYTPN